MAIDRTKIQKQAESYVASGRIDRAIDEFLKLLDDKPNDLLMMNRIGDLHLQMGKTKDAIDMFKRAGMGYERDGFVPKAAAVFKKARRAAPEDADVATRLADLYRQTNMIKDAIQIHIEMAEQFTKKGLLKRALEEFAQVVDLDPKNLKNKVKLADLYNKEGMKDRASSIYLDVAEALAIDQMHSEANQILERAKTMTTSPQVFLTQSRLCVIQKDLTGAVAHLREGLAANPRSPEILEALAEVELQSKNPAKALEALGQIPQLPEKAMALCERALREMAKAGQADEGLKLFKPLGREFARRGMGEVASKSLRLAMQGFFTAEAWLQLAEIAHQSGNKQERIDALRRAHEEAGLKGEQTLAATVLEQLRSMGITDEQMSTPPQALVSPAPPPVVTSTHAGYESTEIDPVRRIQIQQLQRDAENFVKARFMDKAQEAFTKILELDPANRDAINRIADIIKSSGKMTAVQMHYVRIAERLAGIGSKEMALEMLDKAEALFPGSTRLYRRTLGLLGVQPAAPPPVMIPTVQIEAPAQEKGVVLPLDEGPFIQPGRQPVESFGSDLDALIALDEDRQGVGPAAPSSFTPAAPAERPPLQDLSFAVPEPSLSDRGYVASLPTDSMDLDAADLQAMMAGTPSMEPEELESESQLPEISELEPLELEPLPFATTAPVAPPHMPAPVAAGPAQPLVPAELDEELASALSDIDFQLDYGSPEEAKIEIESALETYPNHPELLSRLELAAEALRRLGHQIKAAPAPDSDEGHSFFDLTDVLGDALLESGEGEEMHDATNVVEKIQSVDELFNAFREGVEQQVKGDDYDTHYNLGIAYKEMMLLEPAMEEFKKAMLDPERTLECCSMLSICELAQGHLDQASAWLRQGIDAPGFPPEDAIGLRYDLGDILLQLGRLEEAREQFQLVREIDPEYREVAQKHV
jgi:tetratricopeptide (TPR) repeat protein